MVVRTTGGLAALFAASWLVLGCGSSDDDAQSATASGATTGAGASSTSSGVGGDGATGAGGIGSGATGGAASGGAGGAGTGGGTCAAVPACDAAAPDPGGELAWNEPTSAFIVAGGAPNHRGRDLFLAPDQPQWIIGKFTYGVFDKDLKGEQVDIYLLRDCAAWELLGSTLTTDDGAHATVEGVDDGGGRVYFEIPADKALGPGRHRARLVVRGDLSHTDLFLEVVPPGTHAFVSDVDGTLTTQETEEFQALLGGTLPNANADAAAAFQLLASKGYRPFYLTARPEWLVQRTRDFLEANGFPAGIVHTTLGGTGATGAAAATYKSAELEVAQDKGLSFAYAFGNTATDAEAYEGAAIQPLADRVFYQYDDTFGGRRIDSYAELLGELGDLPPVCP